MESSTMVSEKDFQEKYGLTIYKLQANEILCRKSAYERNNFEILWIQEGLGFYRIGEMQFPFSANTVICKSPGQSPSLNPESSLQGYLISFDSSILRLGNHESGVYESEFFTLFSQLSILRPEKEISDEMSDIAGKMIKESNSENLLRTELLRRYLKVFLLYVLRQFELQKPASHQPISVVLKKFITAVEREFKIKKMVMEYAEALSISANYLNQVVKQVSGNSAGYHIRQRIITEAKHKAIYSDLSMKEIAYDLGFVTPSHFSKFFKINAGINFSDYKDSNQQFTGRH